MNKRLLALTILIFNSSAMLFGQENYEIQVYSSETTEVGHTMFELHSNTSLKGQLMNEGVRPSNNAFRQTVEIAHGFTSFFEIGFYQFINTQKEFGTQWVGSHLRPQISIPVEWNWPVGISLSTEIGYQRREYSTDTWALEIRPIIDKNFKTIYLSLNPVLGKSFQGVNKNEPFSFEPSCKIAFHINPKVDFGAEYYGSLGPVFNPSKLQDQEHSIYAALDLNLHPNFEFNLGTGWGLTQSTDGFIIKLIVGYKLAPRKKTAKG